MLTKFTNKLLSLPLFAHAGLSVAAFAGFQTAKSSLDASYAASRYPVDYATGQLSFSHNLLESYYATMTRFGTLDIYWRTQFIDFGFIIGVALTGLMLGTLIARLGTEDSWVRRLGIFAAYAAMIGASFDVIENLISFMMLQNPQSISPTGAILYSCTAALKFIMLSSAMTLMTSAIALKCIQKLMKFLRFRTLKPMRLDN